MIRYFPFPIFNVIVMDHDQEVSSDILVKDNNIPFHVNSGSDFLTELFDHPSEESELNHAKYFLSADYQEIIKDLMHGGLSSSCDNLKPHKVKRAKIPKKEQAPLPAKLAKENYVLRRANKQLRKKIIIQERSIANYEVKLAQCMTDLLAAKKELEGMNKVKKSYEMEMANLRCHTDQMECELLQYRGLKLRNNEENQKIQELEKSISVKMESIRRLKKNSAAHRLQLAKKDKLLKKLQLHNKQISSLLVEFGSKLTEAGLLTKKCILDVFQKYQEEYFMKASKSIDRNEDLPELTSETLETPIEHNEQVYSDYVDTCIEDQTVTSSVGSPLPTLVSSHEISNSVWKNTDTFFTQMYCLRKKENKFQDKFSGFKDTELEQNCNLCTSPDTSNFTNETCDLSKQNGKLLVQDFKLPTNSRGPIVMDSYSQLDLSDENYIPEVEDLQTNYSTKNEKDMWKHLQSMVNSIAEKENPQNCREKCSPRSTNKQNIISALSFKNESNISSEQKMFEKKRFLPCLSDNTEQDKGNECFTETVNHEKETIDPKKPREMENILLENRNFYINQKEKGFRTTGVSGCHNNLIPFSQSETPAQEEKIKLCHKQTSSISASSEMEYLPAISIMPECVLKNDTVSLESFLNELRKQNTNESNTSDSLMQRTEKETSIFESEIDNLKPESYFERTTSILQDEQTLSDNESNVSDSFLNVLNPISPLPPSPIKNSKSFNLSKNFEEIWEDPQTSQSSSVLESSKDQLLVIEKYHNISYAKDLIYQPGISTSQKSFVLKSQEGVKFETKPIYFEQFNSLDANIINPVVYKRQDVTSDKILCPKIRKCYVALSRCDISKHFSSIRQQTSPQMLSYNQSSCKNFIQENMDDKYKTSANENEMASFCKSSCLDKAEEKESIQFSEDPEFQHNSLIKTNLQANECNQMKCVSFPSSSHFHESNSSNMITDETSLNLIEPPTNQKQNVNSSPIFKTQKCYVSLSRSDIPDYFRKLRNQTPSPIVDYYNNHLTNSLLRIPDPVSLFTKEKGNFVSNVDNILSAQMKGSDNIQHKIGKNVNISDLKIFSEGRTCSVDDLLEKSFNLQKIKSAFSRVSSPSVVTLSNTVMRNSSLNTSPDSLCLDKTFQLKEWENNHKSSKGLESISKDTYVSNVMTPSERTEEISYKILPGNLRECYVSLSKNDIPDYFLSVRKESMLQAAEDKQTYLTTNISGLIPSSYQGKTNLFKNDSDTTSFINKDNETDVYYNSIHHEGKKMGINTPAIPDHPKNLSNSALGHEILFEKSSNLLKGNTLALPNESEKLISCSNNVETCFRSQCLPSIKSSSALFDDNDTSNKINALDKKLDVPISHILPDAEIDKNNISVAPTELQINNLNENSLQTFKLQNCFLLESYAPSLETKSTIDIINPVNKKLQVQVSKNLAHIESFPKALSTNPVELSIKHFKPNSISSSKSENNIFNLSNTETPAEPVKLPITSEHKKFSMKRERTKSSDCNFFDKTSLNKWGSDFIDTKPLTKKRSTLLLPGPSVLTKWKKSSILNRDSLLSEQKQIQTEVHIPTYLTPEFQKKCSSIVEKKNLSRKKIKPLDSETAWVAPVRLRGRTSKSKAFVRMSYNKHTNNSRDSNDFLDEEADFPLLPSTHEENTGNYTSVKPPKIRKQYKKKTSNKVFTFSRANETSLELLDPKPSADTKHSFDFLQKSPSENDGIVHSKEIIDKQLSFNKIKNKSKNEKIADTYLYNNSLNSGINFISVKNKVKQSKELMDEQLPCDENGSQINNEIPEIDSYNTGVSNRSCISSSFIKREKLEDNYMKNGFSNVSCGSSEISSDSFLLPILSQMELPLSRVKPTPINLEQSKQITADNVFFDFLCKQNSTKHKVDRIKEFIDKKLSINKNESKLKYKRGKGCVNKTKSKLKNKSKKTPVNKTMNELKTDSKILSINKSENKLEDKNESLPPNETKSKLKRKRNRHFNSKFLQKPEKEKLKSNEAINPTISSPLSDVLGGIESIKITDQQFKLYIHSLTTFLTNLLHTLDMANLIYHVVNFLYLTRENRLINSSEGDSTYGLLTSAESCIVAALFCVQKDMNLNMQCLTKTVLYILHQLVLTKVKFHIYGLASLCRVLAEICKQNDDRSEALSLCCDILKVNHPFGPYLIASIVTVWKELFMMSESMPEEDILLLRSISFGAQKKPQRLSKSNWNFSFQLLTGLVPVIPDANKAIEFLKNRILIKCLENTFEELWRLTSPFLILVSQMTWNWVKVHIMDMYIIPNMQRFSRHASQEESFDLFCNLCVEVLLLNPELDDDRVLNIFYENLSLTGRNFVRDCVAVSLMKYFILSKRTVPSFLEDWFKNNQDNPKVKILENIFHQRLMSEHQELLTKQDIVIS